MKKRRKFWIAIFSVIICIGTVSICALAQDPISGKMRLLGQIDRQNSGQTNSYSSVTAYVGEHTEINKSDLDRFTRRVALTIDDPQEAQEIALKAVAIREIFAYRAEKAGIPNSDEEFLSWFDSYEASLKSTENYDDVLAYIVSASSVRDTVLLPVMMSFATVKQT